MDTQRANRIAGLLERVATGALEASQALEEWSAEDERDEVIRAAWHDLSHYANDTDLQLRDEGYRRYQADLLLERAHQIRSTYGGDLRSNEGLLSRIMAATDQVDPMGLLELGALPDEYAAEAQAIAAAGPRCSTADECLNVVWEVFQDSFGESAGPKQRYRLLADRIFAELSQP